MKKWIPVLGAILLLLIIAAFFVALPEQGNAVLVELGLAEPASGGYTISGLFEADTRYLSSLQGGTVQEFCVEEGDLVHDGDVIAVLDSTLLTLQREAAQARVDAAEALLADLENAPRREELQVAEAAEAQAQALLNVAEYQLEDIQDSPGMTGFDERERAALAAVDTAEAQLLAARTALEELADGADPDAIAQARAVVDSARSELASLDAAIDSQTLRAPMDGVVLALYQEPGETAMPGWPVAALAETDTLTLTVYLPESDLGVASVNENVEITTPAYPDEVFTGRVIHVADQAEFTPRNVQTPGERVILVYAVEIEIPNPDNSLKPGLSGVVLFEVES